MKYDGRVFPVFNTASFVMGFEPLLRLKEFSRRDPGESSQALTINEIIPASGSHYEQVTTIIQWGISQRSGENIRNCVEFTHYTSSSNPSCCCPQPRIIVDLPVLTLDVTAHIQSKTFWCSQ